MPYFSEYFYLHVSRLQKVIPKDTVSIFTFLRCYFTFKKFLRIFVLFKYFYIDKSIYKENFRKIFPTNISRFWTKFQFLLSFSVANSLKEYKLKNRQRFIPISVSALRNACRCRVTYNINFPLRTFFTKSLASRLCSLLEQNSRYHLDGITWNGKGYRKWEKKAWRTLMLPRILSLENLLANSCCFTFFQAFPSLLMFENFRRLSVSSVRD